jgi:energy-coupling factor transport system substrate-specific component
MVQRIKSDFTTLTLTLIPVAIVINIVVGQIVQNVLKLPIYLDSIGTVLVAVVAGPLAGALTGALSNILWGIIFSNPQIIPFAITAFAIGLMAGLFARLGWFRRELPRAQGLLIVLVVGGILIALQALNSGPIGAGLAIALTLVALILTALRLFPALVVAGGVLTGMVAAIVSAPISAFVFGGVMGSGTDLLVALFQATGANILQAALGQGLVSDPFDKFVSFLVVWIILRGLSRRYLARFPRASNVIGEATA